MNMRKHTLLLFLLLMAMPVLAENRSFRQAREIAERHAAKNGAHIGLQSVKRAKVLNKQQSTTSSRGYYVFPHDGNCGYTIVSGDDRMPEIVGYSTTDTYSEENMPDGMKHLMQAYEAMATALANGDAKAERCLAEKKHSRPTPHTGSPVWRHCLPMLLGGKVSLTITCVRCMMVNGVR